MAFRRREPAYGPPMETPAEKLQRLKARQRARMRRIEEARYLRPLLPVLRAAGVRGRRLAPEAVLRLVAPFTDLPGQDERLDWWSIPGGERRRHETDQARDAAVCEALSACRRPGERLAVVWHTHAAGFRLRTEDFLACLAPILDAGTEVWIVSADRPDWIIEVARFDREVCWLKGGPG